MASGKVTQLFYTQYLGRHTGGSGGAALQIYWVQDVATMLWETLMIPWKVMISALKIASTPPNSKAGTEWARRDIKAWVEMESVIRTALNACLEDYVGQPGWEGIQKYVADQAGASEWSPGKDIHRTSKRLMDADSTGAVEQRKSHQHFKPWGCWALRKVSFRNPELAGILPHSVRKWSNVWLSLCTQPKFLCCWFGSLIQDRFLFNQAELK